jgi:peptide/nickel transport system permease protein
MSVDNVQGGPPAAGSAGTEAVVDPALQALRDPGLGPAAKGDRSAVRRERLRLLLRSPTFIVGMVVVLFWVVCAIFGSSIAPDSPYTVHLLAKLKPPSSTHWFGTDDLGRDVLSRVIVGARDILIVAPLATALGTVAGTAIGLLTGYYGGLVDESIMRVLDAFLAIPIVILGVLALVALGPSVFTVILVIGIVFTPIIARTVRAAVLSERDQEYVAAAKLRHERSWYVMFVEILPNVSGPILVEFTIRVGFAIFTVATLSFLGFGIQPPAPDWGLQISQQYVYLSGGFWWPVLFPALAIATLVVSVNLVSDSLARVLER